MDRFTTSNLRAYYGCLLTDRQNETLRLHYDEDLSLGEIAERCSVSRQAVADAIKAGEKALGEFENKLCFAEKESNLLNSLKSASEALNCGDIDSAKAHVNTALKLLEE